MRLSDIALYDYEWLRGPPSPSAASKRIARHQKEIERDEQNALSIPRELMSKHAKQELGYSASQELELLDIEANKARLRRLELEQQRAARREQAARDAELLKKYLSKKSY
ncbi:hypothetical protein [Oceanicaulis sp.]|uniref:hypothetical protein n=1 Tax=Oceanicaulis sp. TaxID=1924941 RepID=UPI003BA98533